VKDCFCEHLLIDCPPEKCDDTKDTVWLGCLEMEVAPDGSHRVLRICSLEKRMYVLSPRLIRYWLSYVPILPLLGRVVERFCCFDVTKFIESQIKIPPEGQPDTTKCDGLEPLLGFRFSQVKQPFTNVAMSNLNKLPLLRDIFITAKPPTPAVDPKAVLDQPIEVATSRLQDAGIPVLAVESFDPSAGLENFNKAITDFSPGQPVILVERNGVVEFVHNRVAPAHVAPIRETAGRALAAAEEAKQSVVDTSAIRTQIDGVEKRVAAVETKSDDTMASVVKEITRARDDIRKEMGDDVERLSTRIDEARRAVDERDTTIRSLTGTIEQLQNDLAAAQKLHAETQNRLETLTSKVAGIDELRAMIGKLRPPIG